MKLPGVTDTGREATDIERCTVGRNVEIVVYVVRKIVEALQKEGTVEKLRKLWARDLEAMEMDWSKRRRNYQSL